MSPTETQKRPALVASPLLHKDKAGKERIKPWNYGSIIGIMTYLQRISIPDISMEVHVCSSFCANPKLSHERAVTRIGRHLIDTIDRGLVCKVDKTGRLECFVDVDFAGGCNEEDLVNTENVLIITGFTIACSGMPIFWRRKL